ncbi:MAG: HAMP domain-containing sensor histidine kinase [Saprospiraceae bacterium]
MDIYRQKSWWKIVLLVIGIIIIIFTMFYTNYLSEQMAENERNYIEYYELATKRIAKSLYDESLLDEDMTLENKITDNVRNKIILDDGTGFLDGKNWGDTKDEDQKYLQEKLKILKNNGLNPILPAFDDSNTNISKENIYPKIYYQHSNLYQLITWFPIVQVVLIALFVIFGYIIFNSMRRAEQNRVWAGMAKETAHQLGTPISGIIGWTEYLKSMTELSEDQKYAVVELENDVTKLELVADRFSKIGSAPVLELINIDNVLNESIEYIKKRSSKNIKFHFEMDENNPVFAKVNFHLFNWVIENLLRNALDAMEGKGEITVETGLSSNSVLIDVSDTGKGIPSGKIKTVFKPGYSTKKRGWGLGLSFAKRIIEEYHKGKIFVLKSKVNEGTTFRIMLPIN